MLKLKNVSKFYYSKGVVASGFSKLNLNLDMGEFVVITGESGSGKSTLLNVISGLDTYEEGEMYINGEETSHYNESDFENYRRKYIGNIFQNFNLINSYTVYQNIELVLLINGSKTKQVKNKVLDIIRQVDLYRYRNTKVSKLSGGQKQRVAIARALAKETLIIVADEPTGNLDSRSAESVMRTLYEISKDKLVVVVTHNYDQVEEYATRRIKMHDGKIIEDKVLKKTSKKVEPKLAEYKEMKLSTKLKLGIRNTFNIIPKFLLLLLLYCFITIAVTAEYSSLQKSDDEASKAGYNQFFQNYDEKRVIIKKQNQTFFTEEDYTKISQLDNVETIVKNDLMLDMQISITDKDFYFYGNPIEISNFKDKVDYGRLPENETEIIIEGSGDDYYLQNQVNELMNKEYEVQGDYTSDNALKYKLKVVGVKYSTDLSNNYMGNTKFYVNEKVLTDLQKLNSQNYSQVETKINNKIYKSELYMAYYKVTPNNKVPKGQAYISSDMNYYCKNYQCKNSKMTIYADNLYYKENITLKITKTYNKDNYKKTTGMSKYDEHNGEFYINPQDYNVLFKTDNYQSSIFIKDPFKLENTINQLNDSGYETFVIKEALVNPIDQIYQFVQIFSVVLIVILIVGLFFISYFIIKLILKSRNIYFSTIRILGSSKKVAKRLLDIELLTVINIAYFIFLTLVILVKTDTINFQYIKNLSQYLKIIDYVVVYMFLVIMSWFISNRFARKLFKKSAMNTYREEV